MSILSPLSKSNDTADLHIIFIHGLCKNKDDNWKNDETGLDWPTSLEDECDLRKNIKVWLFKYSIPPLEGESKVLTVVDSLYDEIKSKSGLSTGNIIFITHSFGGIIAKQLIRDLESDLIYDEYSTNILKRIKGVFFLATPHTGSVYAKYVDLILGGFFDENISKDMLPNNTYVIELFRWYNKFSEKHRIIHLDFRECIPPFQKTASFVKKLFFAAYAVLFPGGILIKSLLALPLNELIDKLTIKKGLPKIAGDRMMDTGINVRTIPVNEDHFSIHKPKCKSSPVYELTKSIISKILTS